MEALSCQAAVFKSIWQLILQRLDSREGKQQQMSSKAVLVKEAGHNCSRKTDLHASVKDVDIQPQS